MADELESTAAKARATAAVVFTPRPLTAIKASFDRAHGGEASSVSPSPSSSSAFASAVESPFTSPSGINLQRASSTPSRPRNSAAADEEIPTNGRISDSVTPAPARAASRVSFTRVSASPAASSAKLRSCDVYVGYHGESPNLARFCNWLKAELELEGIASFAADRARYSDAHSHEIADRIICSVALAVIVVTPFSLVNSFSLEEIRFFAQKKNLIPLLFDTDLSEIAGLFDGKLEEKDCKDAYESLVKFNDLKLETDESNWRSSVEKTVGILRAKLGRRSIVEKHGGRVCSGSDGDQIPFMRNRHFVGREKELNEIEGAFFGWSEVPVEEDDEAGKTGVSITANAGVVCITGASGIGKTELALEFAHRYSQRYKMVLWLGGGVRYLRQNVLNLAAILGLDIGTGAELLRSFEEQELNVFRRVKREIYRNVPYLIVIDDLESERDWWEEKDIRELVPRNTGVSNVIITTRLPSVMKLEPLQLRELSFAEAMTLVKGRGRRSYAADEFNVLRSIDQLLGRLSFGLWIVGQLLSELQVAPSSLFDAVERVSLPDRAADLDGFWRGNPFLVKLMAFSFSLMDRARGGSLPSRMAASASWLAPAPISSALLASTASGVVVKGSSSQLFSGGNSLRTAFLCGTLSFLKPEALKADAEAALLFVRLGLAKRVAAHHPGCWIQLHSITRMFSRTICDMSTAATAAVHGVTMQVGVGNTPPPHFDHLWASAFLVFGFKSEPPVVQLKAVDVIRFIKKVAVPLAIRSFTMFSRCGSALELLKVSTSVLEEIEMSYESQLAGNRKHEPLRWSRKLQSSRQADECVWQRATLLRATLLETRAQLMLRGGLFDGGEELCRTCISIRRVVLGHGHPKTLAAQETLVKLVRYRSKA